MKGSNHNFYCDTFQSPLGTLYMLFSGNALAELSFDPLNRPCPKGRAPESFIKQLKGYFNGKLRDFNHPVVFLKGTDFEKKVWLTIRKIPYGETRTYGWVAEKTGRPSASRAAGQALGRNPVPIVIPCHRVIASDGSLCGYSEGIDIKRRLLDLEYYASQSSI